MRAVPHLCEFNPGICLAIEEKARKTSQGSRRVTLYILHFTKHPQTLQKYIQPHVHTLQNTHTHTHTQTHITKQYKATTVQIKTNTLQDIPK